MEDKLHSSFTNVANALSAFYKESLSEQQSAFEKGKGSFYQETLEWMLNIGQGDLRYINVESLESRMLDILQMPHPAPVSHTNDGHVAKKVKKFSNSES